MQHDVLYIHTFSFYSFFMKKYLHSNVCLGDFPQILMILVIFGTVSGVDRLKVAIFELHRTDIMQNLRVYVRLPDNTIISLYKPSGLSL